MVGGVELSSRSDKRLSATSFRPDSATGLAYYYPGRGGGAMLATPGDGNDAACKIAAPPAPIFTTT